MGAGHDLREKLSFPQKPAHAMVPAVGGIAGHHEIPHPAQAIEGFWSPPFMRSQPRAIRVLDEEFE